MIARDADVQKAKDLRIMPVGLLTIVNAYSDVRSIDRASIKSQI
jgi:hypothetical protein